MAEPALQDSADKNRLWDYGSLRVVLEPSAGVSVLSPGDSLEVNVVASQSASYDELVVTTPEVRFHSQPDRTLLSIGVSDHFASEWGFIVEVQTPDGSFSRIRPPLSQWGEESGVWFRANIDRVLGGIRGTWRTAAGGIESIDGPRAFPHASLAATEGELVLRVIPVPIMDFGDLGSNLVDRPRHFQPTISLRELDDLVPFSDVSYAYTEQPDRRSIQVVRGFSATNEPELTLALTLAPIDPDTHMPSGDWAGRIDISSATSGFYTELRINENGEVTPDIPVPEGFRTDKLSYLVATLQARFISRLGELTHSTQPVENVAGCLAWSGLTSLAAAVFVAIVAYFVPPIGGLLAALKFGRETLYWGLGGSVAGCGVRSYFLDQRFRVQ